MRSYKQRVIKFEFLYSNLCSSFVIILRNVMKHDDEKNSKGSLRRWFKNHQYQTQRVVEVVNDQLNTIVEADLLASPRKFTQKSILSSVVRHLRQIRMLEKRNK